MRTVNGSTILSKILNNTQSTENTFSKKIIKREYKLKTNHKTEHDNLIQFTNYNQPMLKINNENRILEDNLQVHDNEQAEEVLDSIKILYHTAPDEIIAAQANLKLVNIAKLLH